MNLKKIRLILQDYGVEKLLYKRLSPNDNSKNQVYLGGSFEVLNILPFKEITHDTSGDWAKERFKAKVNFYWLTEYGLELAPAAQLILYPKYPEVRFSGFLKSCKNAPSHLMTKRIQDRILFLGITKSGDIIGYVTAPESYLAKEIIDIEAPLENINVFKVLNLKTVDNKQKLITELTRIHNLGWITSKRLDHNYNILPCKATNCGGYTLEAKLGITPNGYAEPDYLGWEIKQFSVRNFLKLNSSTITLMTPEPNGGLYTEKGLEEFVYRYGYKDLKGRENRYNFGGIHKVGQIHARTGLKMTLVGYDEQSGKIRNSDGRISLIDINEDEAASWSFTSLLKHWTRKHNQACYVPSLKQRNPNLEYQYGDNIILGIGTDFQLFLKQIYNGNIYYDPGIKIENVHSKPSHKRRSQFRISSKNLVGLYKNLEVVNLS